MGCAASKQAKDVDPKHDIYQCPQKINKSSNLTPGDFCSRVSCTIAGHGKLPIKYFCLSPECEISVKQMCVKCCLIHENHQILAIELLDNMSAGELQADQTINKSIQQILVNVKTLRVEINYSLDTLESLIERIKSVSLNTILQPFTQKNPQTASVSALRDVIIENVTWNSKGNIELKERNWDDIVTGIKQELAKLSEEISEKIRKVFAQQEEIEIKINQEQKDKKIVRLHAQQVQQDPSINQKLEDFCSRVSCMVQGHDEAPITYFCLSPECKCSIQLMCINCDPMHSMHQILPIKLMDDIGAKEFPANQMTNNNIERTLANIKALRVEINKSQDNLEESIERMRSKPLKVIVEPFILKSIEPESVSSLRDAINDNFKLNSNGNMQLRQKEWTEIVKEIQSKLNKMSNEFLSGLQSVFPEELQLEIQPQDQLIQEDKYEREVKSSTNVELALIEMSKLKNIVELEINMNWSQISNSEVMKLINQLKTHKNILSFKFWLQQIEIFNLFINYKLNQGNRLSRF